jgi:hypothetical protein
MPVRHGEMMAAPCGQRPIARGFLRCIAAPRETAALIAGRKSKKIRAKLLMSLLFATEIQPEQQEAAKSPIISGI